MSHHRIEAAARGNLHRALHVIVITATFYQTGAPGAGLAQQSGEALPYVLHPDARAPGVTMNVERLELRGIGQDDAHACELQGDLRLQAGMLRKDVEEECSTLCSNEGDGPAPGAVCGADSRSASFISPVVLGERTFALLRIRDLTIRIHPDNPRRDYERERFDFALYGWVCDRIEPVLEWRGGKRAAAPRIEAAEGWQRIRVAGKRYRWIAEACRYVKE